MTILLCNGVWEVGVDDDYLHSSPLYHYFRSCRVHSTLYWCGLAFEWQELECLEYFYLDLNIEIRILKFSTFLWLTNFNVLIFTWSIIVFIINNLEITIFRWCRLQLFQRCQLNFVIIIVVVVIFTSNFICFARWVRFWRNFSRWSRNFYVKFEIFLIIQLNFESPTI